jgi:hypothetical protein
MMFRRVTSRQRPRTGAAVAETPFLVLMLMYLLFGVYEVGRLIQVTQIVFNAAREGARYGATGRVTSSASPVMGDVNSASPKYQTQKAVLFYMENAKIPTLTVGADSGIGPGPQPIPNANVRVVVTNIGTPNSPPNPTMTGSKNFTASLPRAGEPTQDPSAAAARFDALRVDVDYPFSAVRYPGSPLGFFMPTNTLMKATAVWFCARDEALAPDDDVPTTPRI